MRFRCPNDLFSYCTDKPIPGRGQTKVTFLGSGEQQAALPCKLSPKTCGKNITNTELARIEGVVDPIALSGRRVVKAR